jgi:dsDNA-specific endonuclease/ATPase MutS2
MLVENVKRINPGDTVKIMNTGQVGRVVSYDSSTGKWHVNVQGSNMMVEEAQIEKKQILFG